MKNETLLNLDPDDILIRDNVRFGLHQYRIDSLAESILAAGGVRTPITVEELSEPIDGKQFALQVGAYRTAAVRKLNATGAGLTLPARIADPLTDSERLVAQVSENNDRENLSPMDKAITIQKMVSAGLSKMDIRKAFSAPGGRKGIKVQPASNSHINMLLSFLDFPKAIQTKIHTGVLGMGAAYKLTKLPKDKWDAVLEQAEADRLKEIDREEKDETSYLAQTKKLDETQQVAEQTAAELAQVKADAEAAKKLLDEKAAAVAEALKARLTAKKDDKKQANEHFKAAEAELKSAQQVADQKSKELDKLEGKASTANEKAQAAKDRLEAARTAKKDKAAKGKSTKDGAITGKDIDKAASKTEGKPTKLNAAEMREAAKSVQILAGTKRPKTAAVGTLLLECFDGRITDGQLELGIARLIGEEKMPAQPAPTTKKK